MDAVLKAYIDHSPGNSDAVIGNGMKGEEDMDIEDASPTESVPEAKAVGAGKSGLSARLLKLAETPGEEIKDNKKRLRKKKRSYRRREKSSSRSPKRRRSHSGSKSPRRKSKRSPSNSKSKSRSRSPHKRRPSRKNRSSSRSTSPVKKNKVQTSDSIKNGDDQPSRWEIPSPPVDKKSKSPIKERDSRSSSKQRQSVSKTSGSVGKSQSPKRKSSSPRRKSRSPSRKSRSPRRKSRSPRRKSRSPRRKSRSPRRKSRSPRRKSRSPRRKSGSPRGRSRSPKRSKDSKRSRRRSRSKSSKGSRRRSRSSRSSSPARRSKSTTRSKSPAYWGNRRSRSSSPMKRYDTDGGICRAVIPKSKRELKERLVTTDDIEKRLERHAVLMKKKVEEDAKNVNLPTYLNPAMVNVHQYKQIKEKRKLLWSKAEEGKDPGKWAGAFEEDQSDEKFRRLMGIHGELKKPEGGNTETIQKSRQVLEDLEKEYEKSRTFQMSRGAGGITGIGLGFGTAIPMPPFHYPGAPGPT